MARLELFRLNHRPSLRELPGISQASLQGSRKYHLRITLDQMSTSDVPAGPGLIGVMNCDHDEARVRA
jgi:hypothetical protein